MRKLFVVVLCLALSLSGCTIKENELVILESSNKSNSTPENIKDWQFETMSQKIILEKNREALKKIDENLMPITISPDYSTVFAFKNLIDEKSDIANSMVIIGNMIQSIELFCVKVPNGSKKSLGKFLSIKSYQFDGEGNQIAFIDGEDNVYIYNLETEQLQKVLEKYKYRKFSSISWSRDSKRLMFDSRMIFDIASKEFVSIATDSYTPFIKRNYSGNTYIVEMKNNKYDNIVALYNFDNRSYTQIADGIYMDSDNTSLLYTLDYMQGLKTVDLKTLESKTIEDGPVYCANILKSTGDIVYTTINSNFQVMIDYLLTIVNPDTMAKKINPYIHQHII